MADGVFFDEKQMLALGWPFDVVQAIRRVFESDAVQLQAEIVILGNIKADKITPPTLNNLVSQDTEGNIKDAGIASTQVTGNASAITALQIVVTNKVDKVSGATLGNIATLLTGGNIADSGFSPADLVMIVGSGNPEGSVTSNQSRQFFDTAGSTQYNNANVGVSTGWVAI